MKLKTITIENFRSITESRRVPLGQITTLIGANNEGKSNILRAIAISVHSLNGLYSDRQKYQPRLVHTSDGRMRIREDRLVYSRLSDLPLELQKNAKAATRLTLELALNKSERTQLAEALGAAPPSSGELIVTVTHSDGNVQLTSPQISPELFKSKAVKVAQFISERFDVQYIPAVRTAGAASSIVSHLVAGELAKVESDEKYSEALAAIAALQQPVLTSLSESLTATMRGFMPQIKKVTIAVDIATRKTALRATPEILVDDGRQTALTLKGDGVQSIAALAIMRHASQTTKTKEDILIALEEPESHLHPHAVRELRSILYELAERHQVVISTHNPLMTNRSEITSNIIVTRTKVAPAKSVGEIRDELGVRLDEIPIHLQRRDERLLRDFDFPELAHLSFCPLSACRAACALRVMSPP
jgi:putative ATP-dependent endonuclease of the OLD family